jgi:hypothetical protein
MPQAGFEPRIAVIEREKAVHALDRAATVIGRENTSDHKEPRCVQTAKLNIQI